jgi:hypothetical protein
METLNKVRSVLSKYSLPESRSEGALRWGFEGDYFLIQFAPPGGEESLVLLYEDGEYDRIVYPDILGKSFDLEAWSYSNAQFFLGSDGSDIDAWLFTRISSEILTN